MKEGRSAARPSADDGVRAGLRGNRQGAIHLGLLITAGQCPREEVGRRFDGEVCVQEVKKLLDPIQSFLHFVAGCRREAVTDAIVAGPVPLQHQIDGTTIIVAEDAHAIAPNCIWGPATPSSAEPNYLVP